MLENMKVGKGNTLSHSAKGDRRKKAGGSNESGEGKRWE